jgi:hypothetical protein
MTKLKSLDEIQDMVEANLAAVAEKREQAKQKREELLEARRAIQSDADMTPAQKRQMSDALDEYLALGGKAGDFHREWPQIRQRLLSDRLSTDPSVGAAKRVGF